MGKKRKIVEQKDEVPKSTSKLPKIGKVSNINASSSKTQLVDNSR